MADTLARRGEREIPAIVAGMSHGVAALGSAAVERRHRESAMRFVMTAPPGEVGGVTQRALQELALIDTYETGALPPDASPFLQHAVEARQQWRQATEVLTNLRHTLAALSSGQKNRFGQHLMQRPLPPEIIALKRQTDHAAGHEVNWADWIAAEPTSDDFGGMDNEQLLVFLDWNMQETARAANNPRFLEEVEHAKVDYARRLRKQVQHGVLHPELLQRIEHVYEAPVYPGDVFDKMLLDNAAAYAFLGHDIIVMGPQNDETDHIFRHESTHLLGRFSSPLLNEAATETIADKVSNEPKNWMYMHDRFVQQVILTMSNMSLYDYSQFFAGSDGEANQAALGRFVQKATDGLDVVGIAVGLFETERERQTSNSRVTDSTAHYAAAEHTAYAMTAVQMLWPGGKRPVSIEDFRRLDKNLATTIKEYKQKGDHDAADALQVGRRVIWDLLDLTEDMHAA